jgi:hypothetical protein
MMRISKATRKSATSLAVTIKLRNNFLKRPATTISLCHKCQTPKRPISEPESKPSREKEPKKTRNDLLFTMFSIKGAEN